MMTKRITLTKLRPRLTEVIGRVSKHFDRYVITRHGKPEAVILSKNDYESLLETLNIISDDKLMRDIKKAEKDLRKGKRISWDKAKSRLRSEQPNVAT